MKTEAGELLVGAYLKIIQECDVVTYNSRPPGGGLRGLGEIDVVALQFHSRTAYLCEVTTHIRGIGYVNGNADTIRRIQQKFRRLRTYADTVLTNFPNRHFMFWAPVVPVGYVTERLSRIDGLEVIINQDYTQRIDGLRERARIRANDENNDAFRLLQILEHLR